jgi:hypothetical protein
VRATTKLTDLFVTTAHMAAVGNRPKLSRTGTEPILYSGSAASRASVPMQQRPTWNQQMSLRQQQTSVSVPTRVLAPAQGVVLPSARHLPPRRASSDVYGRFHSCRGDMFRRINSGSSGSVGSVFRDQLTSSLTSAPGFNEEDEEMEEEIEEEKDNNEVVRTQIKEEKDSEDEDCPLMMKLEPDLEKSEPHLEKSESDLELRQWPAPEVHLRQTQTVLKLNLGSSARVESIVEEESLKGFMVTDV